MQLEIIYFWKLYIFGNYLYFTTAWELLYKNSLTERWCYEDGLLQCWSREG